MTPQQLILDVEGLFSLPEVYIKVREAVNNPKSSIEDVAFIVNQDPHSAARLLKMVNSSFFGFETEINTVTRAITITGLTQLHDLILATSAVRAFKGIASELVNMKDFWLHSVYCAAMARILARKSNVIDSERLFVCGLLHDLGHLVIYAKCPELAGKVLVRAKQENRPIVMLEKEVLGFDYAEVGGELLKSWKLPPSLYETVTNHVCLKAEGQFRLDAAIIHIANILVLQEAQPKTGFLAPNLDLHVLQMTGLNEEDLGSVKLEAKRAMAEIISLLFSKN